MPARDKDIQSLKEKVYSQYALPAREADRLIEERRQEWLKEAEALGLVKKKVPKLSPQS